MKPKKYTFMTKWQRFLLVLLIGFIIGVWGFTGKGSYGYAQDLFQKNKKIKMGRRQAMQPIAFIDVTRKAGIDFIHRNGAFGGFYYPETFGSGVCVIDTSNDGFQDLVFVNGNNHWNPVSNQKSSSKEKNSLTLYLNKGDGTFLNGTIPSKLYSDLYGMGCSVGDYDNDGYQDLFVSAYGGNLLFHNEGDGTFQEISEKAGFIRSVSKGGSSIPSYKKIKWSTSSLWFDYNRDGLLDLFVGYYVRWSPLTDLWCTIDGEEKSFCGPEPYPGESNRLYQNMGNGKFKDVTKKSGIFNSKGKTLGVSMLDMDEDGWMDLMVANDMVPNKLYRNNHDGTFRNEADKRGLSIGGGLSKAGMGVDSADFENNGGLNILIGNFSHEQLSLFVRKKKTIFIDESRNRGLGIPSHFFLTFGLFFFDYDLDGLLDIFTANGHVDRHAPLISRGSDYHQRPLLFHQGKDHRFEEVGHKQGRGFTQPVLGRGAAYLDFDNDGDLDLVITVNGGRPVLFRNDGGNKNHWLRVSLLGLESNRGGIGALVKVKVGDRLMRSYVKSGSSYLSQSELPLTFGIGKSKSIDWLEVQWPNGLIERHHNLKVDQWVLIEEGKKDVRKIKPSN